MKQQEVHVFPECEQSVSEADVSSPTVTPTTSCDFRISKVKGHTNEAAVGSAMFPQTKPSTPSR